MFNKIFTIIFVGAFFLGCGQEDNSKSPEQAPPPVAQKPLPAECSEQLNFSANWAQDPEAYEYQANYGVQQDDFFLTGTYVGTTT